MEEKSSSASIPGANVTIAFVIRTRFEIANELARELAARKELFIVYIRTGLGRLRIADEVGP